MRGGKRTGAGRPRGDRQYTLTIKIDWYTKNLLEIVSNKSEYICSIIKKDLSNKQSMFELEDKIINVEKYTIKELKELLGQ